MRQIYEHAEAIHLADDLLAELRKPAVARFIGCGVRPVVGVEVGQRHVADAEPVVVAERTERILDGVPSLDAEERGDAALAVRALDVICAER